MSRPKSKNNQPGVRNAADTDQVKKAGDRDKDLARQEVDDIKELLSTPVGRRFYWRLLGLTGQFRSSFTGNSETFFREGERNIGLILMADINEIMPEAYVLMIQENQAREESVDESS